MVLRMSHTQDDPIRGQMRVRGFRRVSHGLFLRHTEGLDSDLELRRDLRAWLMVLPPGSVLTGLTAAALLGWPLPRLDEQTPVFAATRSAKRPRRPGLICSRLTHASRPGRVGELPVDAPEEILLRCARDLGLLDLLILLEGALQAGHVDADRMDVVLGSRRPGVRLLRAAWEESTGKAESAGETVLQMFHRCLDVAFEPQKRLYDLDGRLAAVADLWVVGTTRFHEYDGEVHREPGVQRNDLRRERGLGRTKYVRRGFTLGDLLNHALVTMHEMDRDLGRAHRMRRYHAWMKVVEQSMYSPVGRERVRNRWHREMGVTEWSRTTARAG
jgi:hypothetical protein